MRLSTLIANGLVLGGVVWMASMAGIETKAVELLPNQSQPGVASADFQQLETEAAQAPTVPAVAALATAYLDRNQPGLATAVLEKAPSNVRDRPEVAHLYARALFHRGRAREALAVAREAGEACADSASCPAWLVAKTAGQAAFFEQVVAAGIVDPQADPAATRAAYERSMHEVRLVAMR